MKTLQVTYGNGKKKESSQIQGGRSKQTKNPVGALLKRFVGRISKDKKNTKAKDIDVSNVLEKVLSNRVSNYEEEVDSMLPHTVPEILRVSPMHTSCEVTLIFSTDYEPEARYKISVNDGRDEETDESYHTVLNPSRSTRKKFWVYDDDSYDISETKSNDVTTQETSDYDDTRCDSDSPSSSDWDGSVYESSVRDNNAMWGADSDKEKQCVVDGCITLRKDYEYGRVGQDFFLNKDSINFESLFDASDSDEDDDGGTIVFFEGDSGETSNYHHHVSKANGFLNLTLDTALVEDTNSLSSIDDDHSIRSLVQTISF
uniref:Uncharacterized protein n=1 Tax=Pseudo-nitzschia australis TaxID=44445 RepID=A0A7S4AX70_9STRA|mmetsp:Transcript_17189/g.37607  ORF Transcript_17189/g.37607 Transcript_17189/m.37607 type:complete len:315 (+) Transcript_17189:69-1013(+)